MTCTTPGKPAMWKGNASSVITWSGKEKRRNMKSTVLSIPFPEEITIVFLLVLVLRLMGKVLALTDELNWQKEQLNRYARQKYVGTTQQCEGQIIMDDVVTWLAGFEEDARTFVEEQVKAHTVTRSHKAKTKRSQNLANMLLGTLPVEYVDYYPDNQVCPECNGDLEEIGIHDVRRSLVVVPAQLRIREERVHSMACRNCDTHSTSAHVVSASFPPALLPGSQASPEIVSYIAFQKFQMGSPIYRIEKELGFMGIPLSRATMNGWINDTAQLLKPLMSYLHAQLLLEDVLLGDETTLRVLECYEEGKRKTSYIWLVRTGMFAEHPIVMFRYENSREYKHHIEFIGGFIGYFQSDGFDAYHGLPGITSVGCFSHARGYFVDAVKDGTSDDAINAAKSVVLIFDHMFHLEQQFKDESAEERLKKRKAFVLPEMMNLEKLLDKLEPITLKKSLLGKAITYCRNQWDYMMNVFLGGRLELSNN